MDGVSNDTEEAARYVMVIAATNRPWDLDEAIRRRLEKRIYVPLPTYKGRQELIKICLKGIELSNDVDLHDIVERTEGFSGADLANVCREAAYMPMRRKIREGGGFKNIDSNLKQFEKEVNVPLTMCDFKEALKNVNKSVGGQDLERYMQWMK